MTKENYQEFNFASGQDRKSKSIVHKKRLLTIRCICGTKILVVPNLKAMNRAIKNHINEHKETHNDSDRHDSLEEFLTKQILSSGKQIINLPNVN